jgi:hypothetical protein
MANVQVLHEAVRRLVAERHAMLAQAAGDAELESNRLELLRRRRDLARAVVARCLCGPDAC